MAKASMSVLVEVNFLLREILSIQSCTVCVLVSESWHKESDMKPGHWLGSVLCIFFGALTLLVG